MRKFTREEFRDIAEYAIEKAWDRMNVIDYYIDGYEMVVTLQSTLGNPDIEVTYFMVDAEMMNCTYLDPKEYRQDRIMDAIMFRYLDVLNESA